MEAGLCSRCRHAGAAGDRGFLLGALAWWQSGDWFWLVGAVVLVANWPYTFACIMPINNRLKATASPDAGLQTRALLEKWGTLHAGRSALGIAAVLIFLWASMG